MEAVQLTPLAKYQEDRARIEESVRLLRDLGGNFLEGNPYRDTIHRLEGMLRGMRLCEIAVDM
jgi:hypothetical protein